jgi:hypothetical protein
MMKPFHYIVPIILLFAGPRTLTGQDTIKLTNTELIACTVTEIRESEIEYLPWLDSGKNYHAINKSLVYSIRYSNGKCDTFSRSKAVAEGKIIDTFSDRSVAYINGYAAGFKNYRPTAERVAGVGSFFLGLPGIAVPIIISTSKVKAKQISDPAFTLSNNENYKSGYLAGANKRRAQAVWSSYGITYGVATVATIVAVVALLSYF